MEFEEPAPAEKPAKLTAESLSQVDKKSKKSKKSSTKSKGKPAWAMTEKQQEEEKEQEIDDLLEFAYDLDYDKFMEDFEVRQAFEVIRDRVQEIKQDQDWKKNIADEWNKTVTQEDGEATKENVPLPEQRSVYSYRSNRSKASQTSYKSQVAAEKKKIAQQQADWDRSTVTSEKKTTVEDKVASRIAGDILKDNNKLRGVHSKESIKKLLEREAKR